MKRAALLVLGCSLVASAASPKEELDRRVRERIASFNGTVYLYARNLDTGQDYGIRPDERVRTASTIKLAMLVTVAQAIADGKAKWDEPLTLRAEDKVSGSGVLREFSNGDKLTIRDVVHMMIVVSDNTATNLLVDRFTADAVNAQMDKLGIHNTILNRKVRGDGNDLKAPSGWSAAGKLAENQKFGLGVSTPHDMVSLLEKIERGQGVSAAASKEMIEVLKRQQDDTGMRRKLGDVPIANKTGALDALRSDVGIVYSPKGRIAMAITADGMPKIDYTPDNPGSVLIADLAVMLVEGLGK